MKFKKSLLSIFSVGILFGAFVSGINNSYADEVLQSPQNVSITTNNAASEATVSWNAPLNASDFQNLEYVVTESPDGQEFTTADTTQAFENLSIGQHSFTVKARGTNEDGPTQTITQDFAYTGNVQTFTAPYSGEYKLEVWGAQGGIHIYSGKFGLPGPGGYSSGFVSLNSNQKIYSYVGEQGIQNTTSQINNGNFMTGSAFNGGGSGRGYGSGGGGGTDFRTNSLDLSSRVIVAGGGGGATWGSNAGGVGGGLAGGNGAGLSGAYGGTQTAGGKNVNNSSANGGFGVGGNSAYSPSEDSGGGGGGYYGGAGGATEADGGGGGGSGYIGGVTSGQTIAGNQTFKSPTGTNETGHSGNGYARITFQGVASTESAPVVVNNEIYEANLNITNISQTSTNVSISWTIDENYENVSYKVSDDVSDQEYSTTNNTYTFENLSKGSHTFTIKAFNENNQQISEVNTQFIVSSKPLKPSLQVSQTGGSQARVNWVVDDDGGSAITSYSLKIDNSNPIIIEASETSRTVNLSVGTHEISLTATNSIGSSDSSTESITIKPLPSQVQNLQIVKNSKTVTISWTPPAGYSTQSSGQGFMSSHSAFVTEGGADEGIEYIVESIPEGYSQTTDGTSVTFDLDEGDNTDYQFKVTPIMPFGEGTPNYTDLMSSSNNMGEVNIFVEATITLTLDDEDGDIDLNDIPGAIDVTKTGNEMPYIITTNNLLGYTVSIQADQESLVSSNNQGNIDVVPVDLITVSQEDSQNGSGTSGTPLSHENDNELYSQDQRSVSTGDQFLSTFTLTETPFVNADTYTGTITYTAVAN